MARSGTSKSPAQRAVDQSTTVPAPAERVTVYRNGALVVRRGRLDGEGQCGVEVRGLSLLMSSDSLRVRPVVGTVHGVTELCVLDAATAPPPESEPGLRAAELEIERLRAEDKSVQQRLRHYEALSPLATGKTPSRQMPDAGVWISLHDFAHERRTVLQERCREIGHRLRDAKQRLAELRLAERGDQQPPRFTRGVRFVLDVPAGAEAAFEIEYFVPAARWVPVYDLELEGSGSRAARLSLGALVAQATGEDWSCVELRLATTDLAREATLPELTSWRLGRSQPPRPAFRPLPGDLLDLFSGYDRAPSPVDEESSREHVPIAAEPLPVPEVEDTQVMAPFDALEDTAVNMGLAAAAFEDTEEIVALDRMMTPKILQSQTRSASPSRSARRRRPAAPREPLPPRLRYAYLRLQGPDETSRGQLVAVDPLEHLWSLVEDHETAEINHLRRAVSALRQAAQNLRLGAPPHGTTPLERTSFHHVYTAAGRHDLPSDGTYHRLTVTRMAMPAVIEHRAVPRAADEVFRFCLLETPPTPLPEGPLQVYEDGVFRVTSRLLANGDAIELNLGLEPALRLVGRTVDVHQEDKGVVNQTSRIEHQVRLRLRSSLSSAARVVLYDRLPTPHDRAGDEVEVGLLESTPKASEIGRDPRGRKLPGGLCWELEVAAGETVEVSYRYVIALPAKMEIKGGNRRE